MTDRKVLLPPYMESEPWIELVESIDEVLKDKIDDPTIWLSRLRDLWILKDQAADKIESGEMLAPTDFELPEKELLVRQANMLGFDFKEADLITAEDYQRIARNLALFWYGKGKPNFINFMGFVLNSALSIVNLWSTQGPTYEEYGPMLPEGDPGIGTPIWQGGAWFPTTHVRVTFDPFKFSATPMAKLIALFYAIANYNLVLDRIDLEGIVYIHSVDEEELARIVVMYPMYDISIIAETTDEVIPEPYVQGDYVDEDYV